MLFNPRRNQQQDVPKNQVQIATFLSYRDTYTDRPSPTFSVERILLRDRLERQKKAIVPKLVVSENAFRVKDRSSMDETEIEIRRIQSALNKLAEENFDVVKDEILTPDLVNNPVILESAVKIIFAKAVDEPVFVTLYAKLCKEISDYEANLERSGGEGSKATGADGGSAEGAEAPKQKSSDRVRSAIVGSCQSFFYSYQKQALPSSAEEEELLRRKNMANIRFVGELYMLDQVSSMVPMVALSQALSLNLDGMCTKTVVMDADLEIAVNLLNVIGKKMDASRSTVLMNSRHIIWEALEKFVQDQQFSTRIRFLLQNLLEWRQGGYKPKDGGEEERGGAGNSNAKSSTGVRRTVAGSGPNANNSHMRNSNSTSNFNNNNNSGPGNRRMNSQSSSQVDLRRGNSTNNFQAGGGGGGNVNNSSQAGSSSNNNSMGPGSGGAAGPPAMSEEDKQIALAQPPPSLTDSVERNFLVIAGDASEDKDWAAATASIKQQMPQEQEHVRRMCAVYAIIKKITQSPSEDERNALMTVINGEIFEKNDISRGYSWYITYAIAMNYKEDYPRVLSRFGHAVAQTTKLDIIDVTRDVLARTANYLDALFIPFEGDDVQWMEDFEETSSILCKEWRQAHEGDKTHSTFVILDALAAVRQRQFFKDIAADFLTELIDSEFLNHAEILQWLEKNSGNEKFAQLRDELQGLVV